MTAAGWNTKVPGHDVPDDSPAQCTEDNAAVHHAGAHNAGPHGLRHMQSEYRERNEIEKRGPKNGDLRPQDARCHDGRDRIRSVVKSVEEVEQQRNCDQCDKDGESERGRVHFVAPGSPMHDAHTCLAVMDWMAFATSSHLSTTFS